MTAPLFSADSSERKPTLRVRVALPVPVDRLFTYRVPTEMSPDARLGHRVLVPFSGRRLTGVVMDRVSPEEENDPAKAEAPGGQDEGELEEVILEETILKKGYEIDIK